MTPRLRNLRRPLFAGTIVATLGIGVPAALALTDPPARPRLEPAIAPSSAPTPPAAGVGDVAATDTSGAAPTPAPTAPRTSPPVPTPPALGDADTDDDDLDVGDVSGPCDEAEHAGDPRCTGDLPADDDHSGPGHGGDDDDDRDDRSGSSSGKG